MIDDSHSVIALLLTVPTETEGGGRYLSVLMLDALAHSSTNSTRSAFEDQFQYERKARLISTLKADPI